MTSITRGIRKTTALILLDLVSIHPKLVHLSVNNIVERILTLLAEPIHITGLNPHSSSIINSPNLSNKSSNQGANNKSNLMISILLKILKILLKDICPPSHTNDAKFKGKIHIFDTSSKFNRVITLRNRPKTHLHRLTDLNSSLNDDSLPESSSSAAAAPPYGFLLSSEIANNLVAQLGNLWQGIEAESNHINTQSVISLQEMSAILHNLGLALPSHIHPSYVQFLRVSFANFPHVSSEGNIASSNHANNLKYQYPIVALDFSLCHLVFIMETFEQYSNLNKLAKVARGFVNDILSDILNESKASIVSSRKKNNSEDSSSIEKVDVHHEDWISLLVYFQTSCCDFYSLLKIMILNSFLHANEIEANLESNTLGILVDIVINAINHPLYGVDGGILDSSFVCPAVYCICSLLQEDYFWAYIFNQDLNSLEVKRGKLALGKIILLLKEIFSKSLPMWVNKYDKDSPKTNSCVDIVMKSLLKIVQRYVFDYAEPDSSQLVLISIIYSIFYTAEKDVGLDSIAFNLYSCFSHSNRKTSIEIWYYLQLSSEYDSTLFSIVKCLFEFSKDYSEIAHFLNLLLSL